MIEATPKNITPTQESPNPNPRQDLLDRFFDNQLESEVFDCCSQPDPVLYQYKSESEHYLLNASEITMKVFLTSKNSLVVSYKGSKKPTVQSILNNLSDVFDLAVKELFYKKEFTENGERHLVMTFTK